jgi:hypothetical protein
MAATIVSGIALAAGGCARILGIDDTVLGDGRDAADADRGDALGMAYHTEVIADRPVAYWRLGEPSGALVAVDEIGDLDGAALGDIQFGAVGALPGDPDSREPSGWRDV